MLFILVPITPITLAKGYLLKCVCVCVSFFFVCVCGGNSTGNILDYATAMVLAMKNTI